MATLMNACFFSVGFRRLSLNMYMNVCGISHEVVNNWQHRQLINVDCSHIFGKRYFCCIKFNNFLKSNSILNTLYSNIILQYRCLQMQNLDNSYLTLNYTEIQNFDDVMSDPPGRIQRSITEKRTLNFHDFCRKCHATRARYYPGTLSS